MDARRAALEVLDSVEDGAHSDVALGRLFRRVELSREDRALATRIVYGVLAWRLRIDHTLAHFCERPLSELDRVIVHVLRIGVFQLCFSDRIPKYAAVDSSVSLVPRPLRRATGFVNAVLRRVALSGLAVIDPRDREDRRIAVELSHPEWLVRLWRLEVGNDQALALMRCNNGSAPTILRALVNRSDAIRQLREQGVDCRSADFAPDAIRADAPVSIRGLVIPQGEASQLVALLVGAAQGERILDACAAPGGKSAYLAASVGPTGRVTAVDPGRAATDRIGAVLDSCGVSARVVPQRLQDLDAEPGYDAVLVDAPCSGLGTLREHPEIRWRRRGEDLAAYGARQIELLRAGARHVRRGGRLVYATCTIARVENEDVVAAFLRDHGDFAPDDPAALDPALGTLVDTDCRLRTFPHIHDMAGFFAQRLVRAS
jgi:16S rRNA (cytosine967-C5)-methyltransferase